jgi:hypothetical protein
VAQIETAVLIRAMIFGAFAAAAAIVAAEFVAEAGYQCPDGRRSVYRLLPWGQRERTFFITHVMVYPAAALIGRALGRAWFGPQSEPTWRGTAAATIAIGIVAYMVQTSLTQTFMHIDACGVDSHDSSGLIGLGGPVVPLVVVGIVVGAISGWTVRDRDA